MYLRYLIPSLLSREKLKEPVENFLDGSQVRNSLTFPCNTTDSIYIMQALHCQQLF